MIENDEVIIFPEKIIFKAMTQNFGLIKMRKSEDAVKNAKFSGLVIPLDSDHDNNRVVGFAENFQYDEKEKGWRADILFEKRHLSEDELEQVRTLAKRDLSIEYEYTLIKNSDNDFKKTGILGNQTDLLVNKISWVDEGRCAYPQCGLDTKSILKALDNEKTKLVSHEVYEIVGVPMPECDHLKEIKELKDQIKEFDRKTHVVSEKLDKAEKSLEEYKQKEKDSLIIQVAEKTGKDAKHYKDKSIEFLQEFFSEIKDSKEIKQDGFPPGEDVTDKSNIPMSSLTGTTNISQFIAKPKTDKTFKLVEVDQ